MCCQSAAFLGPLTHTRCDRVACTFISLCRDWNRVPCTNIEKRMRGSPREKERGKESKKKRSESKMKREQSPKLKEERMMKGKGLLTGSAGSGSASHHNYMIDPFGASGSARQEVLQGIPVHEIFPDKDIWDVVTSPFYCSGAVHIPGEIVDPLTISKLTRLNHLNE